MMNNGMNRGQAFQNSFQSFMKDRQGQGGFNGVFAGFGDVKQRGNNRQHPVTPPTTPGTATPLPPITTPNSLDQPPALPSPANPGLSNNPWLNVPQMQPWMNNPMGGNPQWGMWGGGGGYGQPQIGGPLPPYDPSQASSTSTQPYSPPSGYGQWGGGSGNYWSGPAWTQRYY